MNKTQHDEAIVWNGPIIVLSDGTKVIRHQDINIWVNQAVKRAVELARFMWKEDQFNFLGQFPTATHWNYRYESSDEIIEQISGELGIK